MNMKPITSKPLRSLPATRAVAHPPISSTVPFNSQSRHLEDWQPGSWRQREALQQPAYPDQDNLLHTVKEIEGLPPLVFAGECRILQDRLAAAAKGDAFLLFGEFRCLFCDYPYALPWPGSRHMRTVFTCFRHAVASSGCSSPAVPIDSLFLRHATEPAICPPPLSYECFMHAYCDLVGLQACRINA